MTWPDGTAIALLVTLELPPSVTAEQAFEQIGRAREPDATGGNDTPLVRFCRALDEAGVIDDVEIAVPGDHARMAQLLALREEVPASVNRRIGRAKQDVDGRIEKTAGDMIVPFEHLEELLRLTTGSSNGSGISTWPSGATSPMATFIRTCWRARLRTSNRAARRFSKSVAQSLRLGGSPLAEHGVGRNRVKQQLLEELYGREGIEDMRAVKRALDPRWTLASGVLFPRRGR